MQTVILSLDKPIADCFLFRPRKRLEKRRKRSHTNVSNASVTRTSTPPAQTAHAAKQGPSGQGRYHYPRSVPHVHKHPRAGYQNGALCRFWVLVGGAPKERREPRDSDALMRVAVPRRRGPVGLRDLFRFCRNCGLYALRSGPFRVCEARGGITTLSALYVLLKRRTAACQNGSFAVF